ncbi:MAG: peptidoglycan DD-metalloendopeptidase family protein [candidate division Zixibacteria bacterium]|nr:peptidoglycan DD-metalloendopeptidase family protein [candidate division Zixibacteria bacterium]
MLYIRVYSLIIFAMISFNNSFGQSVWPLTGNPYNPDIITSCFGPRVISEEYEFHEGLDFRAYYPVPVHSIEEGEVDAVGTDHPEAGDWIRINHRGYNFLTSYCHLSEIMVSEGQIIQEGQQIALSGNTGGNDQYHLHLGLRLGSSPLDTFVNPLHRLPYSGMASHSHIQSL